MSTGTSQSGEAWRPYFESETLSWCIPRQINADSLIRFTQSDWIQKIIHGTQVHPSGTRVLEAGCGTAMYALCFAILGYTVDAFDYNQRALAFALQMKPHALELKSDLQVTLAQGNLLTIHAASNSYDLVFNQAVLDYFCDDAERSQVFSEMARVTNPGGWVAVIAQHTGHPFRSWWERWGWQGYTNQPSTSIQTPEKLEREFRAAGLQNINTDGLYPWKAFFFYPQWHRRWRWSENASYLLGQVLQKGVPLPRAWRKKLGLQFVVMGQKP